MRRWAWILYLGLGSGATLLYLFGPHWLNVGPVFNAIGASAAVAILIGSALHRPARRLAWNLIALSQLLFVGGDVIAYNYQGFFGVPVPFPSLADAFYLAVYPCLIAGVLLLIRRRSPEGDRASLIDSLIITIGAGLLSWVFLTAPYVHDATTSLHLKVIAVAYPLADVVVLAVVARLAFGPGKREPAFYLLAAGTLAIIVTDAFYGWTLLNATVVYAPGGLLDGGWAAFYLLLGASALHPSMAGISEPVREVHSRLGKARLSVLAGASLMAPAVLVIQNLRHQPLDVPVVATASAALFLLVVARMSGVVHRQEQSTARERALREMGAALVTATNRESIYEAALRAARSLAGAASAVRVLVSGDRPHEFEVVAASGGEASALVGESLSLTALKDWKRERLLANRAIQLSIDESMLVGHLGLPPEARRVFVAPLVAMEKLGGLLIVTGGESGFTTPVADGLDALASQAAMALESARLTEEMLRKQTEARFASLVQNSSDVVTVIDPDTTIRYVSPSAERVLGYLPEEIEGTRFADLIHPDDQTWVLSFLSAHGEGQPSLIEFRVLHKDGSWPYAETLRTNLLQDANVNGIVLNTRDISERKAVEEQLSHQAFHDPVTGLANRALFKDRVQHALDRQRRHDTAISVLFMDLDDFKTVNDSLGHAAGDRLLKEVGERLRAGLRAVDTAARLGGDEFAVLLEDGGDGVRAADAAARILEVLQEPFAIEGREVVVHASIGIATGEDGPTGADAAEEILRNADVAMYMAKQNGKSRYQVFEQAMHDTAIKRLDLKADLQRAVDDGEFVLQYQPVITLATGRIAGVEALVRWRHPKRGMIPPLEFIPLAEETGLIIAIGHWVLKEACSRARELQERYPAPEPLHMAVNLSARQLQRPEIVDEVRDVLSDSGLDPRTLILEITESVMMADMDLSISRLRELKELDVRLAVDDFGTGYSSLNYLRRFPVDILKVDKSFVDGVAEGGQTSALTAAVLELAAILELQPVAEGIERADQLAKLLELGCDLGQGYFFARPLDLADLFVMLEERRATGAAA